MCFISRSLAHRTCAQGETTRTAHGGDCGREPQDRGDRVTYDDCAQCRTKNIATIAPNLLINRGLSPFRKRRVRADAVIASVRTVVVRSGIASFRTAALRVPIASAVKVIRANG